MLAELELQEPKINEGSHLFLLGLLRTRKLQDHENSETGCGKKKEFPSRQGNLNPKP